MSPKISPCIIFRESGKYYTQVDLDLTRFAEVDDPVVAVMAALIAQGYTGDITRPSQENRSFVVADPDTKFSCPVLIRSATPDARWGQALQLAGVTSMAS